MKGARFDAKRKRSRSRSPLSGSNVGQSRQVKVVDGILGKTFGAYTHKFKADDDEVHVLWLRCVIAERCTAFCGRPCRPVWSTMPQRHDSLIVGRYTHFPNPRPLMPCLTQLYFQTSAKPGGGERQPVANLRDPRGTLTPKIPSPVINPTPCLTIFLCPPQSGSKVLSCEAEYHLSGV